MKSYNDKRDIVKFYDVTGKEYILRIPSLYDFLLYNDGQYERVWKRLYVSDLERPNYWRIILSTLFNQIFPSGFLKEDDASIFDVVDDSESGPIEWLYNLTLNLCLTFGYKPHEILKMTPVELSFAARILEYYDKVSKEEEARLRAQSRRVM